MSRCVECGEQDSQLRIAPVSYCDHRVCLEFRREGCRDVHTATCPSYCRAVGRTPAPHPRDLTTPQQLELFG
ncbi:hypothetical protein ACWEN6_13885 [Sphaerisporangium sp. NPDC004334]